MGLAGTKETLEAYETAGTQKLLIPRAAWSRHASFTTIALVKITPNLPTILDTGEKN